jgi:hypothetical protein
MLEEGPVKKDEAGGVPPEVAVGLKLAAALEKMPGGAVARARGCRCRQAKLARPGSADPGPAIVTYQIAEDCPIHRRGTARSH